MIMTLKIREHMIPLGVLIGFLIGAAMLPHAGDHIQAFISNSVTWFEAG